MARSKKKEIVRVVEEMKKVEVKGDKQQIEGKLVLKEEKVYVPKDEALRVKII